jgi:hypothetical protein
VTLASFTAERLFSEVIHETTRRMEVPADRNSPLALGCFGAVICFFAFGTVLASLALLHVAANSKLETCLAVVWFVIVAALVVGPVVAEGGVRPWATMILGGFARRKFLDADIQEDGRIDLRYGFEMFNRRLILFQFDARTIARVHWSSGQASELANRDVGDWSVAIWSRRDDGPLARNPHDCRGKIIRIVGPSQSKANADALGRSVVALLRGVGIELEPTDAGNDFVVPWEGTGPAEGS